jgi:hypothetical protein
VHPKFEPNAALAEILEKTGELDRILDGRGLAFEPPNKQPAAPLPEPLRIEPVDWRQEQLERETRERAERDAQKSESALEAERPAPKPDYPAKPKRRAPRLGWLVRQQKVEPAEAEPLPPVRIPPPPWVRGEGETAA